MNQSIQFAEDPFLCPECSKVGYCIKRANNKMQEKTEAPFTFNDIKNKVPVKSTGKDATGRFGKKLQTAHDLFHQAEYEQASYLYRDMLEWRNDSDEVKLGLSASLFFLNQYDEAVSVALKLSNVMNDRYINGFIDLCTMKMKELDIVLEPEAVNHFNEAQITKITV